MRSDQTPVPTNEIERRPGIVSEHPGIPIRDTISGWNDESRTFEHPRVEAPVAIDPSPPRRLATRPAEVELAHARTLLEPEQRWVDILPTPEELDLVEHLSKRSEGLVVRLPMSDVVRHLPIPVQSRFRTPQPRFERQGNREPGFEPSDLDSRGEASRASLAFLRRTGSSNRRRGRPVSPCSGVEMQKLQVLTVSKPELVGKLAAAPKEGTIR